MAHYAPCLKCKFKTNCDHRNKIQSAIAGLSVTSIKFKCAGRETVFQPGDRVEVKITISPAEVDWPPESTSFNGTIIREAKGTRYIVRIDDGESIDGEHTSPDDLNGNGYAKLAASKITSIDERRLTVCPICDGVKENGLECGWHEHGISHPGCIAPTKEAV